MRICYIGSESPHTQHWAEHFASVGHDVHLICPGTPDYRGVTTHRIKNAATRAVFPMRSISVRRLVKTISPDVLHAQQMSEYGLYGAMSGFHPFVLSAWGTDIATAPTRSLMRRTMLKFMCARADVVHVQDALCERRLVELCIPTDGVVVVPWGVDTKTHNPRVGSEHRTKKVITIVGGGSRTTSTLVNLVSDIHENVREDVLIRVVGYTTLPHELMYMDNIEFVGRVPISVIPDIIRQSDIYIDPYYPASSTEIGHTYGMGLLEAMASGIPTIAANRPTVAMLCGWYHGETFDAYGDATGISDKVSNILTDDAMRREIIDENLASIKSTFDWDRNMHTIENLYTTLLV